MRLQSLVATQSRAASNDPLEVRDLKLFPIREPKSGRRYTLLRLTTRSGLTGWGECRDVTARDYDEARRVMEGQSASAYEVAWRRLQGARPIRAAIDMALLDVLGQDAKAPVYQVLGGPTRNKARALAPLEGPAALERAQKDGFKAFSVQTPNTEWRNQGKAYVSSVGLLMQRLRNAAGTGADFVLDGGGRHVAGDAQSIAEEVEGFHLLWFDEPCAVSNLGAVKKIAGENVTPLGFGRALTDAGAFQDLLREDAVDILRPDLAQHGVSQIRRIAALAETYYVAVAPHHAGGPLATAAALHLAASLPNFFIQEVPLPEAQEDRDMRRAIADVETVRDGFLGLPTGPGLGVRVNEQALEKFRERA